MLLIKNGRVIDPSLQIDRVMDILVEDGIIKKLGQIKGNYKTIDASGLVVAPGLVDAHVHFRDPGFTYKEDLESGSKAAIAGGFTTVVLMANTSPAVDCLDVYHDIMNRAQNLPLSIHQCANVTLGLKGKELTDMEAFYQAGVCGFTDDGIPIGDPQILLKAFEYSHKFDLPISLHEEDAQLIGSSGVNEGEVSRQLGIKGACKEAEEVLIARDCILAKKTGAKIDIQHLSSGMSVDIIQLMKKLGVNVYCEVTPQHLCLTEKDVLKYGAYAKINPPFRTEEDRLKLIWGLKNDIIDMIVTDHAPHSKEEKERGIDKAPSGMIGLETSLALIITHLVEPGHLTLAKALEKMTINPAKFYKFDCGTLQIGKKADIVIFDPHEKWTVSLNDFKGKSVNSPFIGHELTGRVRYTIHHGNIVYSH